MQIILDWISQPWPWYVAGPLLGLTMPLLLLTRNKVFGISTTLEYACTMIPNKVSMFKYDWRTKDPWKMVFVLGIAIGGFLAMFFVGHPDSIAISEATQSDLALLGLTDQSGYIPPQIFSWQGMLTFSGAFILVIGGFLVGFGSRYAGGCTSGHSVAGIANLQKVSVFASIGFFIGGILVTYLILPLLLG